MSVIIRSLNDDFQVADEFACLLEVEDCCARGLYKAIRKWFIYREIPYIKNLITFDADNASILVGEQDQ